MEHGSESFHVVEQLFPIALILISAKIAGVLSLRVGMPSVFGELLVGLLLGPAVLGWVLPSETIAVMAEIGVVLLMFMAGMETDTVAMRAVGKPAFLAAAGGVVLPLVGGSLAMMAFPEITWAQGVLIGAVLMATSVSISAQTLRELGQFRTREGTVIMGAAIIDDVLGVLIFAVVMNLITSTGNLGLTLLAMTLFFPIAWFVGDRLLPLLVRFEHRLPQRETALTILMALVLLYAWSAESLGSVAAITGAYVLGILATKHLDHKHIAHDGTAAVGYAFFIPIFFVNIGLQASADGILQTPLLVVVITAVAIVTKLIGGGLGAKLGGLSWRGSVMVGAGMVSRGEVALVLAGAALSAGAIDRTIFSALIVMTLVTTLLTPPMLRLLSRGEESPQRADA
jgi:Kef-type K+ transport system membrane component KefB